jgi:hypothetical protein
MWLAVESQNAGVAASWLPSIGAPPLLPNEEIKDVLGRMTG